MLGISWMLGVVGILRWRRRSLGCQHVRGSFGGRMRVLWMSEYTCLYRTLNVVRILQGPWSGLVSTRKALQRIGAASVGRQVHRGNDNTPDQDPSDASTIRIPSDDFRFTIRVTFRGASQLTNMPPRSITRGLDRERVTRFRSFRHIPGRRQCSSGVFATTSSPVVIDRLRSSRAPRRSKRLAVRIIRNLKSLKTII